MLNLLLITDVPRLRKIFSHLSDEKSTQLRIANSLEKGAEELAAEKPGIVFVQTHLSGLSADILLMHLKKQLGRKRTRFVLLTPPNQVSQESLKHYQGQLDTTLEDSAMLAAIKDLISELTTKVKKASQPAAITESAQPQPPVEPVEPVESTVTDKIQGSYDGPSLQAEPTAALVLQHLPESSEPSLEEQGITYSPRSRVSVYSEFTSSFDSAVSSMQPPEHDGDSPEANIHNWNQEKIETIDSTKVRSKRTTFLLWFAPVLVAAVAVTIMQDRSSKPKPVDLSTKTAVVDPALPVARNATVPQTVAVGTSKPVAPQTTTALKNNPPPTSTPEAQLSDNAVLSAIAENRAPKGQAKGTATGIRPADLPDFIPRYALDKSYNKANPGWERYKGRVTEFKVYREGSSIKAIQVIDRGGDGVPESFMKAALRQVSKKPAFVMESSEKKEGYEIQRGHVDEHLNIVYYRDGQTGKLRAFVMTWK